MKTYSISTYGKHFKCLPYFFFIILVFISTSASPQNRGPQGLLNPSPGIDQARLRTVVIGEIALTAAATTALYLLWYKGFKHTRFHTFNDNKEWLNMDKAGHATSAYNIAAGQYDLLRWSGVDNKSATIAAGASALGYMSIIEVLDGFSEGWGFSKGDMIANLTGSAIFVAQQALWQQQRVQLRVSYHNTIYSKYNPGELGKTFGQHFLKDYNGQSYWASFNISSFLPAGNNFPRWMSADLGYGAEGMIGSRSNPTMINEKPIPSFERYRKLFFGLGGAIKKEGKDYIPFPCWINIVRLPSPVVEFKLGKTFKPKFYPIYY